MIKIENIKLAKASDVENLQTNKADKVDGKGLSTNDYTNADKDKLSGIEEGANKYVHPNSHNPDIILETAAKMFVSQSDINKWNKALQSKGIISFNDIVVVEEGADTSAYPNAMVAVVEPI